MGDSILYLQGAIDVILKIQRSRLQRNVLMATQFRYYRMLFLPIGVQHEEIAQFRELGGTSHRFCNSETDYIVADSWDEVEDHFKPYPELLQHFLGLDVCPVNYSWLRMCIAGAPVIHDGPYLLSPLKACLMEVMGTSEMGASTVEFPWKTRKEFKKFIYEYECKSDSEFDRLEAEEENGRVEEDVYEVVGRRVFKLQRTSTSTID